ncbi:acyl-CoA dehydrogenase family protein, partial [Nocardia gipuzkoensis]
MSALFPDYRPAWETDQHRELRKHAAEFFRKEIVPHRERWTEQHMVDREFWNKAGDAGLLGLDLPEEFGGAGGDFGLQAVVQEELVYAHDNGFGFSVHSPIVSHYIYKYGNAEQRAKWLPGIISGDLVLAIAMTEPGTGSDLQAVRTTAIREGDHYVVNGSKTFISNGTHCDLLVIVAKTDPSQGAAGVSLIVAETKDLAGFER